jgi:hypothetical protein
MGLLALKKPVGWPIRLLGEGLWVYLGFFHLQMTSIWMWGVLFMCVDSYGWFNGVRRDD